MRFANDLGLDTSGDEPDGRSLAGVRDPFSPRFLRGVTGSRRACEDVTDRTGTREGGAEASFWSNRFIKSLTLGAPAGLPPTGPETDRRFVRGGLRCSGGTGRLTEPTSRLERIVGCETEVAMGRDELAEVITDGDVDCG